MILIKNENFVYIYIKNQLSGVNITLKKYVRD
jgi:hypothetical protein